MAYYQQITAAVIYWYYGMRSVTSQINEYDDDDDDDDELSATCAVSMLMQLSQTTVPRSLRS